MEYSVEQRIKIIKVYWENKGAMEPTIQKLEEIFGAEGIATPNYEDIQAIEARFLEHGSIHCDDEHHGVEEDFDDDDEEEMVEEEEEDDDKDEINVIIETINHNYYPELEDAER